MAGEALRGAEGEGSGLVNDEAVALLRRRIEESGVSSTRFAVDVLWRDPRTVRRWLSGDSPIPKIVAEKLVHPTPAPWPEPSPPAAQKAGDTLLDRILDPIRRR